MSHSTLAARRSLLALAVTALAASAQSAHAQNKLDTVVTTATRTPQKLSEVLADLTVITRADIERQAAASLADLLRNNGCAELTRNGGPASNTSVFLRGADSRHTLVLIDGVKVDSQSTGGASWQGLPLSQIERVEVLKGPASAIYGSDAVGGVVQIFTRKGGSRKSADFGVAAGNLGTYKADGGVFGAAGIFDYALTAAIEGTDGFNATVDYPGSFGYVPDRDGHRKRQAMLRVGAQLSAEQRLEALVMRTHTVGQYDASKSKPLVDDLTKQDADAARLAWTAQWTPDLQTQLSFGESRDRYQTTPSVYLTDTRVRNLALTGSYKLAAGHQLNFTAERLEDRLENKDVLNGVGNRDRDSAGLSYLFSAGAFNLQAHARHDSDSEFGGVDTGTLLAGFEVAEGLRLVGSVGNSFRAPTVYQQASPYGPLSKPGTPSLLAERGRNVEVGLKYVAGATEFSATAYRNRITDLIVFGEAGACRPDSFGCYRNVSKARLQGVSLAATTTFANLNLRGTLDLQKPINADTGLLLARRAKRLASVNADTVLGAWTFGAGVTASGARFDNATNTRKLGGYALLNLNAQVAVSREVKLQLNVDNAFSREYQTAYGYASAPMTVLASLRWTPQF
jgi:vitamin B12 transporter